MRVGNVSTNFRALGHFFCSYAALAVVSVFTYAGTLPVKIDFDQDTPGTQPSTGGIGQPSFSFASPGSAVLVRNAANGLSTKPAVVKVDNAAVRAGLAYNFYPMTKRKVRVEANVSFDRFASGIFIQSSVSEATAVVTRLIVLDQGIIQTESEERITVGEYSPGRPFRVRVDIDIAEQTYSVVVDSELDGFENNAVYDDLKFANSSDVTTSVGTALFELNTFSTASEGPTSVAYDDISISILHEGTGYTGLSLPIIKAAIDKRSAGD